VQSEQVRVFVVNNFPVTINNVALSVKADDVTVQAMVTPEMIEVMRPGQRAQFTVRIRVAEGAPAKRHRLVIGLAAKQVGFEPMDETPVPKLRAVVDDAAANPATRVLAAESLAKRNDPQGFLFLRETAVKHDKDYRSRAIRAIGRVGNKSSVAFLRTLLQERDGYLRGNAYIALALARATTTTIQPGLKDRDAFVRACAKAALVYLGGEDCQEALKGATQDSDSYVQVAAAWGLGSAGDKEAIGLLDKVSASDGDVKLRIFAGDMLISLPERQVEAK
jgi:HEAT repeat protein